MCKFMHMNAARTITVSVATGRATLSDLIKKVKTGVNVIITNHGKPEVLLTAYRPAGKPWRVATPDDPRKYGDLQSPVMEDWQ
jgi:prevent-host-death family protein